MEFNEKLQELRKQKGLTQEELAEALYVSRTAVSKWESGRGYPNIDSLKAISKLFSVTVDELLSGNELLTIAEEDTRQKESLFVDLLFGLLDCSISILFFLPFFGQKSGELIQELSLLSLTEISLPLKILYFALVGVMPLAGILTLALQNCSCSFWLRSKRILSLSLNAAGAFLFIISLQPYAASFLFILLIIKIILLLKKR